ncbi:hypothetical protein EVAR_90800_1 [Eumeta japonica]|uniref:Uncharacterized protein n=1 Tax=Eumeta variegata TaxID=151549 RepID=A0A4C2A5E9_EUMVA|nr:hypothetical protein EVAR_90800_1 [Eumeta japonica]
MDSRNPKIVNSAFLLGWNEISCGVIGPQKLLGRKRRGEWVTGYLPLTGRKATTATATSRKYFMRVWGPVWLRSSRPAALQPAGHSKALPSYLPHFKKSNHLSLIERLDSARRAYTCERAVPLIKAASELDAIVLNKRLSALTSKT